MQLRSVLPLIAIAALAACSSKPQAADNGAAAAPAGMNEQQQAQAEHRAPDPDTVLQERWQALFGNPDKLIAALNDMGYKVDGYTASGSGYAATGHEQTLPDDDANPPATVKTNVVATGTAADAVRTITFTFDTHVSGSPDSDKVRDILGMPRQIINGVLQRFEVNAGDPIVAALQQFSGGTISRYGSTITVDSKPGASAGRFADQHIVVTISRTGDAGSGN